MKSIRHFFVKNKQRKDFNAKISTQVLNRKELEEKAIEGAKKAVKDYRRVFERLAEYDKT